MSTSTKRPAPSRGRKQVVPEFGAYLASSIAAKEWTRATFAEAVGLSIGYTGKLLSGKEYPPSEAKIREIAAALELDPEDLLFRARILPEELERELLDLGADTVRWLVEHYRETWGQILAADDTARPEVNV